MASVLARIFAAPLNSNLQFPLQSDYWIREEMALLAEISSSFVYGEMAHPAPIN